MACRAVFFQVVTCLVIINCVKAALDIEGAKESACFLIKKTVAPDLSWVMSQKDWKYLYGSRLDLYLAGMEQSGKSADELTEEELYNDLCLTAVMSGGTFVSTGFNGIQKKWDMRLKKGMEIMEFYLDGKLGGTMYTTLTDNKTFMVTPACWANGQMSWGVISPYESLPDETVEKIHKHLESLGFKREFFTGDLFKNLEEGVQLKMSCNV